MISQSHFQLSSLGKAPLKSGRKVLFLSIFIVYVALRLIAWQETVLVEDHDSLVYLDQIKTFRGGLWRPARASVPWFSVRSFS
jgi:hypothetical protein